MDGKKEEVDCQKSSFTRKFQRFQEEIKPIRHKLVHKIEKGRIPNSFSEVSITPIPKQGRYIIRKHCTSVYQEH
jgi:hypothetical protein